MVLAGCKDPSHVVAVAALSSATIIIGKFLSEFVLISEKDHCPMNQR
jgi:hypothetical protein